MTLHRIVCDYDGPGSYIWNTTYRSADDARKVLGDDGHLGQCEGPHRIEAWSGSGGWEDVPTAEPDCCKGNPVPHEPSEYCDSGRRIGRKHCTCDTCW